MPRTVTETKTVYKFSELSEEAQEKALEKQAEIEGELYDTEFVYEDAASVGDILGIDLRTRRTKNGDYTPNIYYSGFWSQGDGACFEGRYAYAKGSRKKIREYAPQDEELHRIADGLFALQRKFFFGLRAKTEQHGHYQHSGCMRVSVDHVWDDERETNPFDSTNLPEEELTRLLRDFADWIYKRLEDEYEYRTSEESCKESIEANEHEFLEDGSRA